MVFKMWMPCRSELCNLTSIIHLYIILLPQTQSPATLHGRSWPSHSSEIAQTHVELAQEMVNKKTGPNVYALYVSVHVLPVMVFDEWCLSWTLSQSTILSLCFLSSVQLQRGTTGMLWWVPGVQPRSVHYTYTDFFLYYIRLPSSIHYPYFALAVMVASPVFISKVSWLSKCYSRAIALTYNLVFIKCNLGDIWYSKTSNGMKK